MYRILNIRVTLIIKKIHYVIRRFVCAGGIFFYFVIVIFVYYSYSYLYIIIILMAATATFTAESKLQLFVRWSRTSYKITPARARYKERTINSNNNDNNNEKIHK